MSIIKARGLSFEYGGNGFKIDNLNFEVADNSTVALVGPNGAGKTTLLKIIAGIIEGYAGSVEINNRDIKKISAIERGRLASYVPQSDTYLFDFTVYDMVAMGRRPYINALGTLSAADRQKVDEEIESAGLSHKKEKKFSNLSGGEKRMALIARALAQEAPILLMDEPTTYLDLKHTVDIMRKMAALKELGKTIIFISHSLNLASEAADRVVMMKDGSIANEGAPEKVLTNSVLAEIYGTSSVEITTGPSGRPRVFPKA